MLFTVATVLAFSDWASALPAVLKGMSPAIVQRAGTSSIANYNGPLTGTATSYGDNGNGGNCKLPARADLMFVAFSGAAWDDAAFCGACLAVTGDKGTVNLQITNKCPECPAGSLDLSTTAFNKIISTSGTGPVTWQFVDCEVAGLETNNLSVWWKSGSSANWAGIQIRGAALPVQSVGVAQAGSSSSQTLVRQDYNYFLASAGLGTGPFDVQVHFQDGSSSVVSNVLLNGNVEDA